MIIAKIAPMSTKIGHRFPDPNLAEAGEGPAGTLPGARELEIAHDREAVPSVNRPAVALPPAAC